MKAVRIVSSLVVCLPFAVALPGCQQLGSMRMPELFAKQKRPKATNPLVHGTPAPAKPIGKEERADLQVVVGRSMERNDDLPGAIKMYREAIEKDPSRADALHRLAVLHSRMNKHEQAGGYFRQALRLDPDNPEILADHGYSLYLQRRWAEAERSLRRAISLKPQLSRAHTNLGLVMARTEKLDEAYHHFAQAGCTDAEAHANLMHALLVENRWDEAYQQCQAALRSKTISDKLRKRLESLGPRIARHTSEGDRRSAGARHHPVRPAAYHQVNTELRPLPPTY